jgi:hypothetical protein
MTGVRQRDSRLRLPQRVFLALGLLGAAACSGNGFSPDTFQVLSATLNGGSGRAFHAAVAAANGDVYLVGGQDATGLPLTDVQFAERFRWSLRLFVGEDAFQSATGRVAPLAALAGSAVVAAGGQSTGTTGATPAPQYLPLGSPAVPDGESYVVGPGTTVVTLAGGAANSALVADDQGDLYLIGGRNASNALRSEILRYSPLAGAFTGTGVNLLTPREGLTATLLSSGDILIVGGWGAGGLPLQSAELFDPTGLTVTAAHSPLLPRAQHTATASADGSRVLVYGGFKAAGVLAGSVAATEVAEVYDVTTGDFRAVTSSPMPLPRVYHTATLLTNGDVLIAGGVTDNAGTVTDSAQVFRFTGTGTVRNAAGTLAFPRFGHTATLLPDHTVLVAGGLSAPGSPVPEAERYFPQVL